MKGKGAVVGRKKVMELADTKLDVTCTYEVADKGVLKLKRCGTPAKFECVTEDGVLVGFLCGEHADCVRDAFTGCW